MANEKSTSFSRTRRWGIFLSVIISIVAVVALVAMINYLGVRYYTRFSLSRQTEVKLSPQTLFLLKTITNQVKVTIYYDKSDSLYPNVAAWLDEYHLANPRITVQTVDYLRDASLAQQVKAAYKLGNTEDKNLVIFDCNGRFTTVPEGLLGDYSLTEVPSEKENQREFEKSLRAFSGEMRFTPALLYVVSQKQHKAYFLEDNGEASIEADRSNNEGYTKFAEVLEQSGVTNAVLKLYGTNTIPVDCSLLVIAGPQKVIPEVELAKIRQYLSQGGRLLVLFHYYTAYHHIKTGLEDILADWNIDVGMNVVGDPENMAGSALVVENWNPNNPISSPMFMAKSTVNMVTPRTIGVLNLNKTGPETPKVEELAKTGSHPTLTGTNGTPVPQKFNLPLAVAMEKGSVKGVFQERGTTAIVAVGDSYFLNNYAIDAADNRDFARFAVNWLLDQTELLQGIGPHPVSSYKVEMTDAQMNSVRWLFLGAMPGSILVFGSLVWFRRRR